MLAWAFARADAGARPVVEAGRAGDVVRVILLDESLSMSAVSDSSAAFDRVAWRRLSPYLKYQPGLRADVILAAARPSLVFEKVSSNIGALRDAISTAQPLPQRLDCQAALNRAAELLASAPQAKGSRMELVIISDFQRSSWAMADFHRCRRIRRFNLKASRRRSSRIIWRF